jgi:hypothetical protein
MRDIMDNDKPIRAHLLSLLKGGNAHMTFAEAVEDFPEVHINTRFTNSTYSAWGLIEHIRRTQLDIIDFMRNPKYKEISWPDDYWPPSGKKATKREWENTVRAFNANLKELEKIVKSPKTKLYSKIPWGDGQTVLREILLVADHNAYHIGEFAIMRQAMGTWGKGHKKQ